MTPAKPEKSNETYDIQGHRFEAKLCTSQSGMLEWGKEAMAFAKKLLVVAQVGRC